MYHVMESVTVYDNRDGICGSKGYRVSSHDTLEFALLAKIHNEEQVYGSGGCPDGFHCWVEDDNYQKYYSLPTNHKESGMRLDLLRLVAQNALTIPNDQWDMEHWYTEKISSKPCGCAVGWAVKNLPQISQLGLTVEWGLHLEGLYGFNAVAEAFEITFDHACRLFSGITKATQQQVHDRIIEFCNTHELKNG